MSGESKSQLGEGFDPKDIAKWVARDLQELTEKLNSKDLSDEERKLNELELKKRGKYLFENLPQVARRILPHKQFAAFMDEKILDDHAQHGIVYIAEGKYGYKLIETKKYSAKEIHDYHQAVCQKFKNDKNFNVANICNPFRLTGSLIELTNKFYCANEPKNYAFEIQDYVEGNTLTEIISSLSSINSSASRRVQNELVEYIKLKGIQDIFYFSANSSNMFDSSSSKVNGVLVKNLIKAIKNIGEHRILNKTQEASFEKALDLINAKNIEDRLFDDLEKEKTGYGMALDSSPDNIVLRHNLGTLSKENIKNLSSYIKNENFVHVDIPLRPGHVAEDLFLLLESYPFRKVDTIFGFPRSDNCFQHLKGFGYDNVSFWKHHLVGFYQSIKRADVISGYATNLCKRKDYKINSEKKLNAYKREIRYNYARAKYHLDRFMDLSGVDKNNQDDVYVKLFDVMKNTFNNTDFKLKEESNSSK